MITTEFILVPDNFLFIHKVMEMLEGLDLPGICEETTYDFKKSGSWYPQIRIDPRKYMMNTVSAKLLPTTSLFVITEKGKEEVTQAEMIEYMAMVWDDLDNPEVEKWYEVDDLAF